MHTNSMMPMAPNRQACLRGDAHARSSGKANEGPKQVVCPGVSLVDGPNLYGYVGGRPSSARDILGLADGDPVFGSGQFTVGPNCKKKHLGPFSYLPEAGGEKWKPTPVPDPGTTVDADGVYMPSGSVKIKDHGSCVLECDKETGQPKGLRCKPYSGTCAPPNKNWPSNPHGPNTLPPWTGGWLGPVYSV